MYSPESPIPNHGASSIDPGRVRTELAGILASSAFASAKSAGRFLRYIVEETLSGRSGQIKEYAIGVEVFGRGDRFDPRIDAVVRVEATRLRHRLREYYRNDGGADRVTIEIPKGGYIPVFRSREARIESASSEPMQFAGALQVKPEAYDCYLRGRFYAQRQNKEDNETAILALERAVAIDPNFASAHAELAQTYVWKLFLFAPNERQWEEKAFMAVEKALSLDSGSALAHLARGRLLWTPANHFPHEKAIREYRRALALNPNLDEARNQLALIYCHIGYFDQALQESQKAVQTNPNNNLAVYRTGQTLVFQGEYEQALAVLRSIPGDVNPSLIWYQIAWALFNLGQRAEAFSTIERLLREYPQDSGGVFTSVQAVLAASVGEEGAAESKITLAVERGKGFGHFHHTAYHIAIAFALMNKTEKAMQWLEAAATDGFPCYPLFERDANLDNLRQDTRFIQFMGKLKQQWADYGTLF